MGIRRRKRCTEHNEVGLVFAAGPLYFMLQGHRMSGGYKKYEN